MYHIHTILWSAAKKRSVQTLLVLCLFALFAPFLSAKTNQGLYTISLLIKEVLIWMMPLTVAVFITHTVQSFKRQAPWFILILLVFEFSSNFMAIWYSSACAQFGVDYLNQFEVTESTKTLEPLWSLPFSPPRIWSAEIGAFAGLILGCIGAFSPWPIFKKVTTKAKNTMQWILTNVFARLIPLFVLGFAAHMYQMNILQHVFTHYSVLVLWLIVILALYLVFLVALGAGWGLGNISQHAKNLLPAAGIALTSGCSLSTMPWTISGTAKNLKDPKLAQAIIPATTNIQQIGDCIANVFLCFLIYRHFYGTNPDLLMWLTFMAVFTLARFATAAVIGGAIFVMIPIYINYLHFTPEMVAIILALNVVLDPLITSTNVFANGALCRVFEKVWSNLQEGTLIKKKQQVQYEG